MTAQTGFSEKHDEPTLHDLLGTKKLPKAVSIVFAVCPAAHKSSKHHYCYNLSEATLN